MSQQKEDFIAACENSLHFYGGIPAAIVPDNLKSAVTKSSKYEPSVNETFADFAEHYSTTVLPTRAYQQFEEVEKMTLMPLPALRYELKKQCYAIVAKNGHIGLGADKHYYSVPYRYIGKKVKLLYSRHYYNYERIALHNRVKSPYQYTTDKEHLASTHRFVSEWTPERFTSWAAGIHEDVKLYILKVLGRKQHPEQAYKACMGILLCKESWQRAAHQGLPAGIRLWSLQLQNHTKYPGQRAGTERCAGRN
ncbi:Mu transposase domain-containing protein [Niabella aquatica]